MPGTSKTLDVASVRIHHRRMLIRLLWESGDMSRAEVARQTGLSRSTVSSIVSELIDRQLVSEIGSGSSSGGRKPILLSLADDDFVIAGIDVGASHVAVAITNLRCEIREWRHERHDVRNDPAGTLKLVTKMALDALHNSELSFERLIGVGLAMPSPMVEGEPNGLSSVIMPKWAGYDLRQALRRLIRAPVFMDNDANLGALAEHWWGAGRGEKHLVYIKLATGIGAGLVLNGEVYHGSSGIAGEVAHTSVEPDGPLCICGQRGCLGLVAGSAMMLRRVREQIEAGRESSLTDGNLTPSRLVEAALAGDGLAVETVQRAGHVIGIGIANLVNVLDPGLVVLGGELSSAGHVLLGPLVASARSRSLSTAIAPTRIVTTQLGERDIALGAATLVLREALRDERLLIDARPVARPEAAVS
ncbi:MAG: ROK family transcriptional regulator [Myxococcota bacterium]